MRCSVETNEEHMEWDSRNRGDRGDLYRRWRSTNDIAFPQTGEGDRGDKMSKIIGVIISNPLNSLYQLLQHSRGQTDLDQGVGSCPFTLNRTACSLASQVTVDVSVGLKVWPIVIDHGKALHQGLTRVEPCPGVSIFLPIPRILMGFMGRPGW